jgi:hypothetical protein
MIHYINLNAFTQLTEASQSELKLRLDFRALGSGYKYFYQPRKIRALKSFKQSFKKSSTRHLNF